MKFSGKVGYGELVEDPPGLGVWKTVITERPYFGDVLTNNWRSDSGEYLNQDVRITNNISVVADAYALMHYSKIDYVVWDGVKWTVSSREIQYPRLILRLGEVYNERSA